MTLLANRDLDLVAARRHQSADAHMSLIAFDLDSVKPQTLCLWMMESRKGKAELAKRKTDDRHPVFVVTLHSDLDDNPPRGGS